MGKAEEAVEGRLARGVARLGGVIYKFPPGGRRGVPDRVLVIRGRTIFVETKAPDGKTSAMQDVRIAEIREAGGDVRLIYSIQEVDALLNEFSNFPLHDPSNTPQGVGSTRQGSAKRAVLSVSAHAVIDGDLDTNLIPQSKKDTR